MECSHPDGCEEGDYTDGAALCMLTIMMLRLAASLYSVPGQKIIPPGVLHSPSSPSQKRHTQSCTASNVELPPPPSPRRYFPHLAYVFPQERSAADRRGKSTWPRCCPWPASCPRRLMRCMGTLSEPRDRSTSLLTRGESAWQIAYPISAQRR